MEAKQKILIIVGPTSSGKSALAVELAKRFNGEVISADSRQAYRGLNIGTGKITKREMQGIPHHLLDVISPNNVFTAYDFAERAHRTVADIASRGKLPIVAGGTGLYIDALTGRITLQNVKPDPALRVRLSKKPTHQLYEMLILKDPKRAKAMNTSSERSNKVRLIRALEIANASDSTPINDLRCRYDTLWIGIAPPFTLLEKKIATRLHARIQQGMVAEARKLHTVGLSYKRMRELGLEYRWLSLFLQNKITKGCMTTELSRAIRKYAKRQLVYWKRNQHIIWFAKPDVSKISNVIRRWL